MLENAPEWRVSTESRTETALGSTPIAHCCWLVHRSRDQRFNQPRTTYERYVVIHMSTALIEASRKDFSSLDATALSSSAAETARTACARPVIWGERSANRSQHIVRPGQRARQQRPHASSPGRGIRSDCSRPSRRETTYGTPSMKVSSVPRPMRSEISGGTNLTRTTVMWALVLGTFFGVYGSIVFQAGEQEDSNAALAPVYVSTSAQ